MTNLLLQYVIVIVFMNNILGLGVQMGSIGGADSFSILNYSMLLFLFIFSLLLPAHYHCAQVYNITRTQPLARGQTLVSSGHIFELGFFIPNGSANMYVGSWHKNILPRKVVWVANREKPLAAADSLASLRVSSNGTLELVDEKQISVWSTNMSLPPNSSTVAVLLDDGNFVVNDHTGAKLWKSFHHPGDTILPNIVMGFDQSGNGNFLSSWRSENDPSTGSFLLGLAQQTPSQVFIWTTKNASTTSLTPYWRSGPWDKTRFIGVPEMEYQYLNVFNLYDNLKHRKQYFSYSLYDKPAYIDLSSEGIVRLTYSKNDGKWHVYWEAPKRMHRCDIYGACGPFGVCNASGSPICKCLKGFVPKSNDEWSQANWTGGCVRQTKLFCERRTDHKPVPLEGKQDDDGFWKIVGVKVPDHHEYINTPFNAEVCKLQCLNNCFCLAYAFVNNIGCLVWSKHLIDIQQFSSGGVDIYVRLARKELGEGKPFKLIASLTATGFVSILVALVFGFLRLRANRKEKIPTSRDTLREYIGKHDPSELLIYDFDTILTATNNFSITNKLGQGGFGPVYKGMLQDGKEVAVKRLSSSSGQGIEEFKNEMLLISNLQHKNLVRIMGCCIKGDEKLLVYEFMPNKSLDTFLFG